MRISEPAPIAINVDFAYPGSVRPSVAPMAA
jgi:hypothetical protein